MARIRIVHRQPEEIAAEIRKLKEAGHKVEHRVIDGMAAIKKIRDNPPDVIIVDLTRLPSHGRDLGLAFRHYKDTRHVPLVFAGGLPEKVSRVRSVLPDAAFTPWSRIRSTIRRAIANPPEQPVAPPSLMFGYSRTPLPKKLGIKAGSRVLLVGAPKDFEKTLGELPEGVTFSRRAQGKGDLVLWFVRSPGDLRQKIKRMGSLAGHGGLWIAWQKKAALSPAKARAGGLTQAEVRKVGLASGMVDYKICSIDEVWSGLRFKVRS